MFSCFECAELFCRSLNGLSFCVNFFELISCLAMVYTCGVPGCTTGYKSNRSDKKITVFGFPSDENFRKKWVAAIPRKVWQVSKSHKVCSEHLLLDDILTTSSNNHDKRRCDRDNQTLKKL